MVIFRIALLNKCLYRIKKLHNLMHKSKSQIAIYGSNKLVQQEQLLTILQPINNRKFLHKAMLSRNTYFRSFVLWYCRWKRARWIYLLAKKSESFVIASHKTMKNNKLTQEDQVINPLESKEIQADDDQDDIPPTFMMRGYRDWEKW